MTHQIAFVNYWICWGSSFLEKLRPFNYWNQLVPQALIICPWIFSRQKKHCLHTLTYWSLVSDSQHQSIKLLFLAEYICFKVQIHSNISPFKQQNVFHLHSLRTSSTLTPSTWARCTSTTRVSYNTYRSRLRRRWTASRGTRSPRVPAPVAVNATALRIARHVPSALRTVRRRTSASTASRVRSNRPLLEHYPTSACPWTPSRCWPII